MDQSKEFSHKERLKQASRDQFDGLEDPSERLAAVTDAVEKELQENYETGASQPVVPSDDHDRKDSKDQPKEDKTPWQQAVDKAGLTYADARSILDKIILQGEPFRKQFKVYKDIYVTFQSRDFEAVDAELWFAERERPHFDHTLRTIRTRHQLAQMMYALGSRNQPEVFKEDSLKERLMRINAMDHTYVGLLVRKMYKFQAQVDAAFTPGFEKHF